MTKNEFKYSGRDLEAMSFARRYHQWILSIFNPYVGSNILEVGAGSGSVSKMLLEYRPKKAGFVEPSKKMYGLLKKNVRGKNIYTYNAFFGDIASKIRKEVVPDSIFYVNVLEHVPDDKKELELMYELLPKDGHIFIFVPALPRLMSTFDKRLGHFRRYTKPSLKALVEETGFSIQESRYFDFPGIFPWYFTYTLSGSNRLSPGAVDIYDKFVIPLIKPVENTIHPLIGKNVILIAKKT